MKFDIVHGDCCANLKPCDLIFADPPDNIGLGYVNSTDDMGDLDYVEWFRRCLAEFCSHAPVVWVSFNSRWLLPFSTAFADIVDIYEYEFKPCVQVITFYQQHAKVLGQAHRPLWRLKHPDVPENTQDIKIPSWRQLNRDKRAAAGGKVPGDAWYQDIVIDEVFNHPRVVGNSRQRRSWHPTQLNEGLVERCIRLNTNPGDLVCDPFAGTGTTLRVCKRINRDCLLIDNEVEYIDELRKEHGTGWKMCPNCCKPVSDPNGMTVEQLIEACDNPNCEDGWMT